MDQHTFKKGVLIRLGQFLLRFFHLFLRQTQCERKSKAYGRGTFQSTWSIRDRFITENAKPEIAFDKLNCLPKMGMNYYYMGMNRFAELYRVCYWWAVYEKYPFPHVFVTNSMFRFRKYVVCIVYVLFKKATKKIPST